MPRPGPRRILKTSPTTGSRSRRIPLRAPALAAFALACGAGGIAPQPNPFVMPKSKAPAVQVHYTMSGDMTGEGQLALDGARMVDRSNVTTRMMGQTSTSRRFTLTSPDSIWTADVGKKKGTVVPNVLPLMARAYDGLDRASRKRLHANMKEMVEMFAQAFGASSLTAFDMPAGVTWGPDPHMQNPDSLARGFVGYLAGRALSDSLAAAAGAPPLPSGARGGYILRPRAR